MDGTIFDYVNWANFEPNNAGSGEDCVASSKSSYELFNENQNSSWVDNGCSASGQMCLVCNNPISGVPTNIPTAPTSSPSSVPTGQPSFEPTGQPTNTPTISRQPTKAPGGAISIQNATNSGTTGSDSTTTTSETKEDETIYEQAS